MSDDKPWNERPEIWKGAHAHLNMDLLPFILLSPADVRELTELAMSADDPAAWLGTELNKRGQRKKDIAAARKIERMAADAKKIADPASWPVKWQFYVKTQPWITEAQGFRRGVICPNDLTAVAVNANGDTLERFDSIAELVKVWSVD